MADYFDSDLLSTIGTGPVKLDLHCGYGQPVATTVYIKDGSGAAVEHSSFKGDVSALDIGPASSLNKKRVLVFSTVHDIRDESPGNEMEDILVEMKIYSGAASVAATFIKKTTGKGTLVNCRYEVVILNQ